MHHRLAGHGMAWCRITSRCTAPHPTPRQLQSNAPSPAQHNAMQCHSSQPVHEHTHVHTVMGMYGLSSLLFVCHRGGRHNSGGQRRQRRDLKALRGLEGGLQEPAGLRLGTCGFEASKRRVTACMHVCGLDMHICMRARIYDR